MQQQKEDKLFPQGLMPFQVKIKLLDPSAKVPVYSKQGDAGADLFSIDWGILEPGERRLVRTGVALEIPPGFVGLVHPRSGLASKLGITVLNAPGTVDSGYRGEIKVNLHNTNTQPYSFCIGDRIAQIVFQEYLEAHFEEVEELNASVRGINGIGSTGVN
jgi:dUTP pyrophosphatase